MLTNQRNQQQVDEIGLAHRIAKEIIADIESYVNEHLEKYEKFTLNAPHGGASPSGNNFFNLISSLKDVAILGRILLEFAPQFNAQKQPQHISISGSVNNSTSKLSVISTPSSSPMLAPNSPSLTSVDSDRRLLEATTNQSPSWQLRANSSKIDDDSTSEDLLAALIESSSSDDFLVLSSSLESITTKEMLLAAFIYITSHECFTLSHDIQGVVIVLRRTKFMILNILAPRNQMELITKLLTSISRYSEMNYVFDLFRDRNQFEMLLSKGVEKTPELRIALFYYVKKNPEFYDLVTLNFSMFREIAESLEANAITRLDRLISAASRKKEKKGKGGGSSSRNQHNNQQRQPEAAEFHSINEIPSSASSSALSSLSAASTMIAAAVMATTAATTQPNTSTQIAATSASSSSSSAPATRAGGVEGFPATTQLSTAASTITGVVSSFSSSASSFAAANAANPTTAVTTNSNLIQMIYSKEGLNLSLLELVDASDCFAKAGCYKRSNYCEQKAKLIALQLALLPTGTNVLGLAQSELNDLIVGFESFSDAFIVAEAYNYHLAWRQALFRNVILRAQPAYLNDYQKKCDLSSVLVEELVLLYKQYISSKQLGYDEGANLSKGLKLLLSRLVDVELKCKIYSQLNFDDAKEDLLKEAAIQAHLKDLKLA